nr:MAG TPA: hypothetical protein [Caudoviricetes sp.]
MNYEQCSKYLLFLPFSPKFTKLTCNYNYI